MELMDAIKTRRSNRRFKDEAVPKEKLDAILAAAFQAPSAHNVHPLEYIVVTDKTILKAMAEVMPYGKMLAEAGAGIVIVGRTDLQEEPEWLIQDGACAMENMLLTLHDLNLGGVYLGVLNESPGHGELKTLLEVPSAYRILSVCALGVPEFIKNPADRFESHRIHDDQWGSNR